MSTLLFFFLSAASSPLLMQGEVEHEQVEARVRTKQKELRACHAEREKQASLNVRFEIAPDGTVEKAEVREASSDDVALQLCVLDVFRSLRFDAPEQGTVVVNYPIQFGAQATAQGRSDRLTQQSIKDVLLAHRPQFVRCYEDALKMRPQLRGAPLTLAFNIGNDGSAVGVEIHSSHGVQAIDGCVQREASALRFARPREGERAQVQYPFVIW